MKCAIIGLLAVLACVASATTGFNGVSYTVSSNQDAACQFYGEQISASFVAVCLRSSVVPPSSSLFGLPAGSFYDTGRGIVRCGPPAMSQSSHHILLLLLGFLSWEFAACWHTMVLFLTNNVCV